MWFLGIILNGLMFVTLEPFTTREACYLAAKTALVGHETIPKFECINVAETQ
jgi:hypothetical protein